MTTLEAINKIKQMFAEAGELPMASVEPTQSFAEYSLKSGAKVMIDKLEVGGKVSLVDESGLETPAPAGEHELIDGTVIVLDEAATILEVKVPEVEAPAVEVEVEVPVQEDLMKKKIEEMHKTLTNRLACQVFDYKLESVPFMRYEKEPDGYQTLHLEKINSKTGMTEIKKYPFSESWEKKNSLHIAQSR